MSHEAILKDLASKLPVRPNARRRQIWIACMLIGAAAFAFLLMSEPRRAWSSYAINTIYWLGLAMGGVVLSAAIRLCNGRWGGPIQRIGESLTSYIPFGLGFMVILLAAGVWTYLPWTRGVGMYPWQRPFLNVPFLWIRTVGGIALFWFLASKLVRVSLRRDAKLLLPHVAPELRGEYEKLSADWKGDEAEDERFMHETAHLSPQIVLTFVVFMSVMGWDFIMCLTPSWTSQLFGWFVYAGAFLAGMCMVALIATQVRSRYQLEAYITPNHFWDIGKVIFSFCIFWIYLFWSQYLPIWYANMPEETWWVFIRFENPWRPLAFACFYMIFLIPFLGLMNKTTKSSPFWMSLFSTLVLSGVWLERHVLVMPSVNPAKVWVGLPEIGVTIGFLGVFGWAVQGFLTRYPAVRVVDALAPSAGPGH
ncbi:MAG TPA: hypothetical protein VMJ70_13225 [Candidatus Sulfotelmatobacter sp.]|nr:hypothetical protein [Candidatus Sulfotelmatobacter sp.]